MRRVQEEEGIRLRAMRKNSRDVESPAAPPVAELTRFLDVGDRNRNVLPSRLAFNLRANARYHAVKYRAFEMEIFAIVA